MSLILHAKFKPYDRCAISGEIEHRDCGWTYGSLFASDANLRKSCFITMINYHNIGMKEFLQTKSNTYCIDSNDDKSSSSERLLLH